MKSADPPWSALLGICSDFTYLSTSRPFTYFNRHHHSLVFLILVLAAIPFCEPDHHTCLPPYRTYVDLISPATKAYFTWHQIPTYSNNRQTELWLLWEIYQPEVSRPLTFGLNFPCSTSRQLVPFTPRSAHFNSSTCLSSTIPWPHCWAGRLVICPS